MQGQNSNISVVTIVGVIFFVILFAFIILKDTIFGYIIDYTGQSVIEESSQTTSQTTSLMLSLSKIDFDTAILSLPYIQNLTPFPSYPIDFGISNFGKANPFSGNNTFAVEQATSTTGGIIYSTQRSLNNNSAIRGVNSNTR